MALGGGNTGHPNQYSLGNGIVLGYRHGLRCLTRPWSFIQPLVMTGTTDVISDTGCCRAMDPDIAICSLPGPDDMAPGDSTGHSYQLGLEGGMALVVSFLYL